MIRIIINGYELTIDDENIRILEDRYESLVCPLGKNAQTFLHPDIDSDSIPTVPFEAFCLGYFFALVESGKLILGDFKEG